MNKWLKVLSGLVLSFSIVTGASATTNVWTNVGGDHEWTNAANWSAGLPIWSSDILIDDSSGASPILMDGSGQSCSTITFSKSGGFTIQSGGTLTFFGNSISVLCSNQSSPYSCPVPYVLNGSFMVAPGSTLWGSGFFQDYSTVSVRGGGAFRYSQDWHTMHSMYVIADNSTVDLSGAAGASFNITNVTGSGPFGIQWSTNHNIALFNNPFSSFNSFTGMVVLGNAAGTVPAQASFDGTNVLGMNLLVYTNAALAQYFPAFWPLFFTNCMIQGNGLIVAVGANYRYGPDVTNLYAGCSFRPGTNSTSAGILSHMGSIGFGKWGTSNSVLRIKMTGTNGVAGFDCDKLALSQNNDHTGGLITSASDPVNHLADCALVVDLSALPSGLTLTGKTNTILTTWSDLSASYFSSVQWINGTGTVNYLNQKVTLTGVSTVPPVPRGTVVTIY